MKKWAKSWEVCLPESGFWVPSAPQTAIGTRDGASRVSRDLYYAGLPRFAKAFVKEAERPEGCDSCCTYEPAQEPHFHKGECPEGTKGRETAYEEVEASADFHRAIVPESSTSRDFRVGVSL